jgi:hypothetical protein
MLTYFLTVFKMLKLGFTKIDKFRRSFLWKGKDFENVKAGHCLVKWSTCSRHTKLGGLSIKDLEKYNHALRMRWLSYMWNQKERPWKGIFTITD